MEQGIRISREGKVAFIYNSLNDLEQKQANSLGGFDLMTDELIEESYQQCLKSSRHYRAVLNELGSDEMEIKIFIANLSDAKINRIISTIVYMNDLVNEKRRSGGIAILGLLIIVGSFCFQSIPLLYYGSFTLITYLVLLVNFILKIDKIFEDEDVHTVYFSTVDQLSKK